MGAPDPEFGVAPWLLGELLQGKGNMSGGETLLFTGDKKKKMKTQTGEYRSSTEKTEGFIKKKEEKQIHQQTMEQLQRGHQEPGQAWSSGERI